MQEAQQTIKTYDVDSALNFVTQYDSRTVVVYNRRTTNQVAEYKLPPHVDCRDWSWMITRDGRLEITWIARHE